jgi:nucleoside-diphosphate-sugar epimerase
LGIKESENETFHVTSDEWLSWNRIFELVAETFNTSFKPVYIPSENFLAYNKDIGASLVGDKAHSMIFDNTKIKNAVTDFRCSITFEQGVKEIASWYRKNSKYAEVNEKLDRMFDRIIKDYAK